MSEIRNKGTRLKKASDDALSLGIFHGREFVADRFKYRNKIWSDVAVEALGDGWHGRRFAMNELTAAEVCRVRHVLQPYLEMLM
ncbi:MAG: hypothetical protein ABI222_08375 [Opitutaceae bacterium]